MKDFRQFNSVILRAFNSYSNTTELINKKLDILHKTTEEDLDGDYLFLGFSPACLRIDRHFYISEVDEDVIDFLTRRRLDFTRVDINTAKNKSFDFTIALDEYLTYAESEQEQNDKITRLAQLTRRKLVTSLRDYKNQDYRDRDFSAPTAITANQTRTVFFECHDYVPGQYHWTSHVYELAGAAMSYHGPFSRFPMYFKQLAKFSYDAGSKNFLVEKSLMYKGLIRKNFEHVISITY